MSLLAEVIKYWRFWVPAVLVATNLFTVSALLETKEDLNQEKKDRATEVQRFRDAQDTANNLAKQAKRRIEEENKRNAEQATQRYDDLLDKYRANLVRYKTDQSVAPGALHYQYPTPGVPSVGAGSTSVPSGTSPDSITISLRDADICAVNTARLQAAHEWAKSLSAR